MALTLLLTLCLALPLYVLQESPAPERFNLIVENHQVMANNQSILKINGTCGGKFISFAKRKEGRFILTTQPEPGFDFQRIGRLEGNVISFRYEGVEYEWQSSNAFAAGVKTADIWVCHQVLTAREQEEIGDGGNVRCASHMKYFQGQDQ